MADLLQNLVWQVVEADEVSDLLGVLVLNHDGVDNAGLRHQVVGHLVLAPLEREFEFVLHLLVEAVDLWDVFALHEAGCADNVQALFVGQFVHLHVSSQGNVLGKVLEACFDQLFGVYALVEVLSLRERMWKHRTGSVVGLPGASQIHSSSDFLDQNRC